MTQRRGGMLYGRSGDHSNARARSFALWEQLADRETVSAGCWHTVGLKSDGTVVAVGDNDDDQCDAADWRDIVAVSAGRYHTVGLKSDGTVVAEGSIYCGLRRSGLDGHRSGQRRGLSYRRPEVGRHGGGRGPMTITASAR